MSFKPEGRPDPYWKSREDWYEFFHFACPSCKKDYVAEQGSAVGAACVPQPVVLEAKWDPSSASIGFRAVVICTCMVRFEVGSGGSV